MSLLKLVHFWASWLLISHVYLKNSFPFDISLTPGTRGVFFWWKDAIVRAKLRRITKDTIPFRADSTHFHPSLWITEAASRYPSWPSSPSPNSLLVSLFTHRHKQRSSLLAGSHYACKWFGCWVLITFAQQVIEVSDPRLVVSAGCMTSVSNPIRGMSISECTQAARWVVRHSVILISVSHPEKYAGCLTPAEGRSQPWVAVEKRPPDWTLPGKEALRRTLESRTLSPGSAITKKKLLNIEFENPITSTSIHQFQQRETKWALGCDQSVIGCLWLILMITLVSS